LDKSGGSKAARAVQELHDKLPMARIVYVSATGVAEPEHLACLSRLGLWGNGKIQSNKYESMEYAI
jgi:hypothetical protein